MDRFRPHPANIRESFGQFPLHLADGPANCVAQRDGDEGANLVHVGLLKSKPKSDFDPDFDFDLDVFEIAIEIEIEIGFYVSFPRFKNPAAGC
jgi:hypothetical protein